MAANGNLYLQVEGSGNKMGHPGGEKDKELEQKTYTTKASANRAAQKALHHLDTTPRDFKDFCSALAIIEEGDRFRAIATMMNSDEQIVILREALGDYREMVELVRDPTYKENAAMNDTNENLTEAEEAAATKPAPEAEGEKKTRRGRTAELRIKEPTVEPKPVRKSSKLGTVMQLMSGEGATTADICQAFGRKADDLTHVNYVLNWIATDRGYQVVQEGDKLKVAQEVKFV